MNRRRTTVVTSTAAAVLALATLAGCGGDDGGDTGKADGSPTASASPTELPPATAPGDISTTTTASALPVPSGGPTEVGRFPVPEGVKVKGPGPQGRSWQFDIITKDTGSVLAFYRSALAAQGYTVKNDVVRRVGGERVHYDIEFSGPGDGYIVAVPDEDDVFVLVESLPTNPPAPSDP